MSRLVRFAVGRLLTLVLIAVTVGGCLWLSAPGDDPRQPTIPLRPGEVRGPTVPEFIRAVDRQPIDDATDAP